MRSCERAAVICLVVGFGLTSAAVDGVLEINQACAVNTGCFPGDGAGFPVSINASGSYRLTSALVVSSAAQSGISLANGLGDVTLDLNGFEIRGPGSGSGSAIALDANQNVVIRGGALVDFGVGGVNGGVTTRSRVVGVSARSNGSAGISLAGDHNRVEDCLAEGNGRGIDIGNAGGVHGCTIVANTGAGVDVSENLVGPAEAAAISDNRVYDNGGPGISCASDACRIEGNLVVGNGGSGISASNGSLVAGNVVRDNAATATANDGGILVYGRSSVRDNTVNGNAFNNIAVAGTGNAITSNHIVQGAVGIGFLTGASGNYYDHNLFSGNTTDVASPGGGTDGGNNVSF